MTSATDSFASKDATVAASADSVASCVPITRVAVAAVPSCTGSGVTDCCTASTETPCSLNMVAIAASTPGRSTTSRVIW